MFSDCFRRALLRQAAFGCRVRSRDTQEFGQPKNANEKYEMTWKLDLWESLWGSCRVRACASGCLLGLRRNVLVWGFRTCGALAQHRIATMLMDILEP